MKWTVVVLLLICIPFVVPITLEWSKGTWCRQCSHIRNKIGDSPSYTISKDKQEQLCKINMNILIRSMHNVSGGSYAELKETVLDPSFCKNSSSSSSTPPPPAVCTPNSTTENYDDSVVNSSPRIELSLYVMLIITLTFTTLYYCADF